MAALTRKRDGTGVLHAVLATGNSGKLREFQALIGDCVSLTPQSEFGIHGVEESGATFTENALIKARHASGRTGLPAIADDSGLEVDFLNGAPGIRSARYAGEGSGDLANLTRLLDQLAGVGAEDRTARFRCVTVFVRDADDSEPWVAEGVWEGWIATKPIGENGFGYDPVFAVGRSGITAAQLDPAEKNLRSHRGAAIRQLGTMLASVISNDEER